MDKNTYRIVKLRERGMVEFLHCRCHTTPRSLHHEVALKPIFYLRTHQEFGSLAKINAEGTGKLMGHEHFSLY